MNTVALFDLLQTAMGYVWILIWVSVSLLGVMMVGALTFVLFGIDAPESRTRNKQEKAHGLLAKKFVQEHCQVGERYILRTKEKGKFGRWLGEIKTRKGLITKLLIKNKAAHEANRKALIEEGKL